MFYLPGTLFLFLLLLLLLPILWFLGLAIDVVSIAVMKLGFERETGLALLLAVILGSGVNIPLYPKECEAVLGHPVG